MLAVSFDDTTTLKDRQKNNLINMKSHLLLKDHSTRTYQYIGYLTNDKFLTNNVSEMIDAKMDVACQTLEKEPSKFDTLHPGYEWDENLYSRLLNELETRTGKTPKRW